DEADAAQDKGADDALAEIRVGDDQCAQLLGRDQKRLDVFFGVGVNQRRGTREGGNFGEKLPRSPSPEWHDVAKAVALAHQDRAFQHDEHARSRLARRDQSLAALVASHLAEVADARDLRICELRKHLVTAAREPAREVESGRRRAHWTTFVLRTPPSGRAFGLTGLPSCFALRYSSRGGPSGSCDSARPRAG